MAFIRKESNATVTDLKVTGKTFVPPRGQQVLPVYHTRFNELIDYIEELEFELTGDVLRNLFDGTTGSLYQTGGNVAAGDYNIILGFGNTASGNYSLIGGTATDCSKDYGFAAGANHTLINGDYQAAFGRDTVPSSEGHGAAYASGMNDVIGDAQHETTHFYADLVSTGPATATSSIYAGGTNQVVVATGAVNRVDVWWTAIQYAGASGPTGTLQSAHEFAIVHNATGTTVLESGGTTDNVPAEDWGTFGFAAAAGKWNGTFTIVGDRDVKLSAKVQIVKVGI